MGPDNSWLFYFFFIDSHIHPVVQATNNNSSANLLIPAGISPPCTTFLNTLNTDPTLASCLSTLTNITSAFAPGGPTPSSSEVTSTLTNLCANSVPGVCSESLIRTQIMAFYAACPNELTSSPVQAVRTIYDVLYALLPLQTSICSKDDSKNWCVYGPAATARDFDEDASFSISEILALLYIKKDSGALTRRDQAAIVPNTAAIASENLPYLFFTPNLSEAQLCVPCLRQVLTAYIKFESDIPFSYGLNNSVLLGAQSALYTAVQSKCPANFLTGAVQAAGGLSGSSAIPTYGGEYQRIFALVMGAVTMMITVAL